MVVAEFGDSFIDENAEAEGSREEAEPNIPEMTTAHATELVEFQSRRPQSAEITDV